MNKYISVLKLGIFITLMSVMSNAIDNFSSQIENPNVDVERSALGIFEGLKSFARLLTFQIDGIPTFINVLIAVPISLMVLFLIIDVVKDLVPFT